MSFLFKKVAAQDEKAYGVPADLWNKIRGFQCSYIIADELKKGKSIEEVETRLYNSAEGSQIPGRYNDFMKGVEVLREMKKRGLDSCGEDSAQHDSNEEIFMNSHIRLFNEAKEKGDAKFLDWLKRSWNAAKVKPNYKAMSNNPAYRKLDKMAQDSAAMDEITESQLKISALYFARDEVGKYADELRKKRDSLADLWEKTGIARAAIKSGEYKQADIDEFINPYVNMIEGAMRILERI